MHVLCRKMGRWGQQDPALRQLRDLRIVTTGGGTSTFAMLSGIKRYPCSITAVVSMADSGGSSRRLMDKFGHPLPLGNLRAGIGRAVAHRGDLVRGLQLQDPSSR